MANSGSEQFARTVRPGEVAQALGPDEYELLIERAGGADSTNDRHRPAGLEGHGRHQRLRAALMRLAGYDDQGESDRAAAREGRIPATSRPNAETDGRCVWCDRSLPDGIGVCADCIPAALNAVTARLAKRRSG